MAIYNLTALQLRGAGILNSFDIPSGSGSSIDPDAQAFITAANITDPTQISAVNTLVVDMKTANIWTKMKALYPFVGGTASSHKFNLKDPRDLDAAFRLTFNGGWVHSNTGALPNGVNGYANTYFSPFQNGWSDTNAHLSYHNRSNTAKLDRIIGISDANDNRPIILLIRYNGSSYWAWNSYANPYPVTDSRGFYLLNRTNTSRTQGTLNGSIAITSAVTAIGTMLDIPFFIGNSNVNGVPNPFRYTDKECMFSSFGDSLSTTEITNYYSAVQAFQTTLNRQV